MKLALQHQPTTQFAGPQTTGTKTISPNSLIGDGRLVGAGYAIDRATVRHKKTGHPVKFEISELTRQPINDFLETKNKVRGHDRISPCKLTLNGVGGDFRV